MRKLLLVAFILFRFNCFGQVYSQNDFVQIPTPAPDSKEWHDYNLSMRVPIKASIEDGQVKLSKGDLNSSKIYQLKGGKLLAIDDGEWGGGLYYIPDDGKKTFQVDGKSVTASNALENMIWINKKDVNVGMFKQQCLLIYAGNVNNVFRYKGVTYFTEGLAHMGINDGAIYKLETGNGIFNVTKVLDLDEAIRSVTTNGDAIYLATYKRLYVVKNCKKELIFDNLFWYGFNPSSIAVKDSQTIYVGMVGFYAKIDLAKKELLLYKFNK
jgi:hypothetical protein